jgi:hypothetical protein
LLILNSHAAYAKTKKRRAMNVCCSVMRRIRRKIVRVRLINIRVVWRGLGLICHERSEGWDCNIGNGWGVAFGEFWVYITGRTKGYGNKRKSPLY